METLLRLLVGTPLPARWVVRGLPSLGKLPSRAGLLELEIVSHCWRYGHLLIHQLASLIRFPPHDLKVRMTVFYAPEDRDTARLLDFVGTYDPPGVEWNWQPVDRRHLMRRAIGRNRAALNTRADWIWFTDCDVVFHEGCLDGTARALQGCSEPLVHPAREWRTSLLGPDDPLLAPWTEERGLPEIDPERFHEHRLDRATGPMQITHGDAARALGYCDALSTYQEPADAWQKATEDRAFRWLLGTQGMAVDIPGVYRIRHAQKGRYGSPGLVAGIRGGIRRLRSWVRERGTASSAAR